MSFAAPLVLVALLAIPLLVLWYLDQQRVRRRATEAFAAPALTASVAPDRPGWRRHAPLIAFAVAAAVLIIAAAKPQRSVAVPLDDGAVMLVNDVSSSMASTDVKPSRLVAGERASIAFLNDVPASIRVGLMEFNQRPILLQSPTRNHALARSALGQLHADGHTAIGVAIQAADKVLQSLPPENGRRPPGAIVVLSDGTSTNGIDPVQAARQSAQRKIPIYTVALGTPRGTIQVHKAGKVNSVPVPLAPTQLGQIAQAGKGKAFTVADTRGLSAVYAHLAAQLGRTHVKRQISAAFVGGGLLLIALGIIMSLRWFGRLI